MFVAPKGRQRLFLIFSVMIALGSLSSATAKTRDEHTVLYMSFDQEPDKDFVQDESGYENHGAIKGQGIEWIEDGKFGGALEFDGTTKIEIPHSDSLNLDKEMTLEIWFQTELPLHAVFLIFKGHIGGGRNYEWGIYVTGDSTNASMYVVEPGDGVKTASLGGDYKDDKWHFLAGTYDGAVIKCYVDGRLATTSWPNKIRTSEGSVVIGAWSNCFTGVLDEARICNVVRTEAQLKSDYESGYNLFAVNSTGKLSTTWAEIKTQ